MIHTGKGKEKEKEGVQGREKKKGGNHNVS